MAILKHTVEQSVYKGNMSIAFWLFKKRCNCIYHHGNEPARLVTRNFFTTGTLIKFLGRLL